MIKNTPPKFATRLLRWFCHDDFYEELQGDLEEKFYTNVESKGLRKARARYRSEVLKLIRPSVIKKVKFLNYQNNTAMFKNYTLTAVRNISRNKLFTAINALGLSLCISTGLLVLIMLMELNSFDNFHHSSENLYRVITKVDRGTQGSTLYATTPAALNHKISTELASISGVVKLQTFSGEMSFNKKALIIRGLYASPDFFNLFNFSLIQGIKKTALDAPNSIILTEDLSKKFFQDEDPIGQTLELSGLPPLQVTGVLSSPPKNSHIQFEALISFNSYKKSNPDHQVTDSNWSDISSLYTYIRKSEQSKESEIEKWLDEVASIEYKEYKASIQFQLQPIRKAITGQEMSSQLGTVFPNAPIFILIGIGIAIILAGSFNYANLSIARALTRMKEVGIRKSIGSTPLNIFLQFLTETTIMSVMAFILAIIIFSFIRDYFLQLFYAMNTLFDLTLTPKAILASLVFSVVVGLLGGIYPALLYSKINSIKALKGMATLRKSSGKWRRNIVTITQFSLVFLFVVVNLVIKKQYNYIINFDRGLNANGIVAIPLKGNDSIKLSTAFSTIAGVTQTTLTQGIPGSNRSWSQLVDESTKDSLNINSLKVGHNFFETFEIEMLFGTDLPEHKMDGGTDFIIVNERFVDEIYKGHGADILGHQFTLNGSPVTVLGVVSDFVYSSPLNRIAPVILHQNHDDLTHLNLKIVGKNISDVLANIKKVWETIDPANEMESIIIADYHLGEMNFLKEAVIGSGYVGLMLSVVSCLGLLGVVSYNINYRLKELCVRKILGATSKSILFNISKTTIILLSCAAILGITSAFFILDNIILTLFYYRIKVSAIELLSASLLVLIIVCCFLFKEFMKVLNANPVKYLRNE